MFRAFFFTLSSYMLLIPSFISDLNPHRLSMQIILPRLPYPLADEYNRTYLEISKILARFPAICETPANFALLDSKT